MNGAHIHLIIGHIPLVGAGFTILLFLFAFIQKSKELKRTALWFSVIIGIASLVVYLTGDSAEDIAKTIPGITEETIDPHESMALFYMLAMCFIGIIALAGLFLSRASVTALHKFAIIILILNILAMFLAYKTGISGGKIRHTEIENYQKVK